METQKTKAIEVKNEEIVKSKKEQKVSISYTLKSFGENIKKFEEAKLATKEEVEEVKKLHKTLVERWIGLEFNL